MGQIWPEKCASQISFTDWTSLLYFLITGDLLRFQSLWHPSPLPWKMSWTLHCIGACYTELWGSPGGFAACHSTHRRCYVSGDKLHVTFGEPASLPTLEFPKPPHILLLQHRDDLQAGKQHNVTGQQHSGKVTRSSALPHSCWSSGGCPFWLSKDTEPELEDPPPSPPNSQKHTSQCPLGNALKNLLWVPVPAQERERSLWSLWQEWKRSAVAAALKERSKMGSDWLKRLAMRPILQSPIGWLCLTANLKHTCTGGLRNAHMWTYVIRLGPSYLLCAKVCPVTVNRGCRWWAVSRSRRGCGYWLLGFSWSGGYPTDGDFTVRNPFCIISWKPPGPTSELPAQPAGLSRLGLIHLWGQDNVC